MVQLKYFGDSRDYFKYDLITHILNRKLSEHYVFIPMLTKHRDDNEGRRLPTQDDKSKDLLAFIKECNTKSLEHWKKWLCRHSSSYSTVSPVDKTYFEDKSRLSYWPRFTAVIKKRDKALVFVDPDTGLETGSSSYRRKMGSEKYILNGELIQLFGDLRSTSILMIYQHLPRNRHQHNKQTKKKLDQAISQTQSTYACAYREEDLAYILLLKSSELFKRLSSVLKNYKDNGSHEREDREFIGN